jgi:hypothetical protein
MPNTQTGIGARIEGVTLDNRKPTVNRGGGESMMTREREVRRHCRFTKSSPAHIGWNDRRGEDKFINGRTMDISESGIRIEVPEPLDKQTYITLQCSALGLHGRASVRCCIRKGMKYLVGLEFTSGLQWRP